MGADRVVIIGAGPAGLTAAYELQRRAPRSHPVVLEASRMVGGISRTEERDGYRFDIGGHRFFTKVPEVEAMWHEVLGADFITVSRMSRIYYRGRFYAYPLKVLNALWNIGLYEAGRILISYLKWQIWPHPKETNFEEWTINRFGGRLYMHFFRAYTEKVWGISPRRIQADWAAQRIKSLSLMKVIRNSVFGGTDATSLIERFQYPRLGPGMMWERVRDSVIGRGGEVRLGANVTRVLWSEDRVIAVGIGKDSVDGQPASEELVEGDQFINSMALRDLIEAFDPPPPDEVRDAAQRLRYRDFLIVALQLDQVDPFPDNWIYIHSPEVLVGRIQNFRAWSRDMVADESTASIGMEYFVNKGDRLWSMPDEELRGLAASEIEKLGLADAARITGFAVIRQEKAYPVYDAEYRDAVEVIRTWLQTLRNFQTAGRNGLHRYNNQDHSMLTAMLAVRNILGEENDLWTVNVERSYHEEFETKKVESGRRVQTV
ncbi:Adrenodoxin reductase [Rubellimicrobium mesophilum DSM 19309]|uniref:Adrenodoxin reductase n=1 Tax=Rubellimicrobium mesophilum DSM 19309 TaxID=442562 RepID=A0A017HNS9_9RHOB|nr:Adrenodoxin reductase [Rubellimicrobium mesophilum DSM 19309]